MTGYRVKVMDAGAARHKLTSTGCTNGHHTLPVFPQLRESHRIEDFATVISNTRSTNGVTGTAHTSSNKHSMASNLVCHFKSSMGFRTNDTVTGVTHSTRSTRSQDSLTNSETSQTSQISASIPVQVKRRGSIRKPQASGSTDECSLSLDSGNASNHNSEQLKKVYDMRTWDMYMRITEARKRSKPPSVLIAHAKSTAIPHAAATGTTIGTPAPLNEQGDCYNDYVLQDPDVHMDDDAHSTYSSEHEMVFALED